MENQNNELYQPAAKSGLILGLIGIITTLLIYFINAKLLANIGAGIFLMVFFFILVLVLGFSFRKQSGGFLSFKDAFLYSLILLLVAGLIGQAFNYLLFNVIDPDLPKLVTDAAIENTEAMMEKFNLPDEQMDEALEKTELQMANQYTLMGVVKGYLWSILVYAVIALITGAIIKKRNPDQVI